MASFCRCNRVHTYRIYMLTTSIRRGVAFCFTVTNEPRLESARQSMPGELVKIARKIEDAAYDADHLRAFIADDLGATSQIRQDPTRSRRHPIDWAPLQGTPPRRVFLQPDQAFPSDRTAMPCLSSYMLASLTSIGRESKQTQNGNPLRFIERLSRSGRSSLARSRAKEIPEKQGAVRRRDQCCPASGTSRADRQPASCG